MIERQRHLGQILQSLVMFAVVAMLGPRQVGKTTLARQVAVQWPGPTHPLIWKTPMIRPD